MKLIFQLVGYERSIVFYDDLLVRADMHHVPFDFWILFLVNEKHIFC
jgi:hypothetical protein